MCLSITVSRGLSLVGIHTCPETIRKNIFVLYKLFENKEKQKTLILYVGHLPKHI
jgi:hypothetical protein